MSSISRSDGITPSERFLAIIAERTFLNLWSYPNLYNDKKQHGSGAGKELCDLLVVFENDVIIFSDKSVNWPLGSDASLSWKRWFRRAIQKSVDQVIGAERWLKEFPDRVFIDSKCTQKLPIDLPALETRRVHVVVVATGAHDACMDHFGDADSSFAIRPDIVGNQHVQESAESLIEPFTIGDVNPGGSFVHVFDASTLSLVMRELDTVRDFVRYLYKREDFVRSGHLFFADAERDLLGYYLQATNASGDHDFVAPDGKALTPDTKVVIESGQFDNLLKRPEYRAKKEADKVSYVWDDLILKFSSHILAGTSVSVFGDPAEARESEKGLRIMAAETRFHRRMLALTFTSMLSRVLEERKDRFTRIVLPGPNAAGKTVAYIFLVLAYPAIALAGGYEQYRKVRVNMLHAYAINILADNRHLRTAVAIGFDAPTEMTGRKGGTEDLLVMEVPEWSAAEEARAAELKEKFHVLDYPNLKANTFSGQEYPSVDEDLTNLSRQQRRARERDRRKLEKRRMRRSR